MTDKMEQELRASNNSAQLRRYQRMVFDTHFLVGCKYATYQNEPTKVAIVELKITGSAQDVYTVNITESNNITCDCPDALCNCHGTGCYCKHACYALSKIGHIDDASIFQRKRLTTKEKEYIVSRITNIINDRQIVNLEYLRAYRKAQNKAINDATIDITDSLLRADNARNLDEDCPICYNTLDSKMKDKLRCCPSCTNAVHIDCAINWLKVKKCCVMCSDEKVWENVMSVIDEHKIKHQHTTNYVNLREHIPSLRYY
jgi:hypothetical protein